MKKVLLGVMVVVVCAAFVCGCATPTPVGFFYTDVKIPVDVTSNQVGKPTVLKVGVSTCQSILGLVATGDASLDAAMKSAGIKTVYYVDWRAVNILGIIGNYTTIVYGE
jgi:hypothetical protein